MCPVEPVFPGRSAPGVIAAVAPVLYATGSTADPISADPKPTGVAGSDLGTSGSLAPVRLPGDKATRTYSPAQREKFERTGGDPEVLEYWTPERMKAAKPLDAPGDAVWVENTAWGRRQQDTRRRRRTSKQVARSCVCNSRELTLL